MAEQTASPHIKLPERLIGSVDLSRTIRELRLLDDALHQATLRTPGQPVSLPRSSQTLEEIASLNGVSLLDETQRKQLLAVLEAFAKHAPRLHMSFAAEPSARFTHDVVVWLRQNISPVILLEVGLQPALAAGCTVRTRNKMFDMSLRHRFAESRHLLSEKIAGVQA